MGQVGYRLANARTGSQAYVQNCVDRIDEL
jgi:ribosome assembly protein YihI (activator of Der GTPase)